MSRPVDVLAVMAADAADAMLVRAKATNARTLCLASDAARAAVAELVEAARPVAASLAARITQDNAMSPQAVMTRRLVDALAKVGGAK